jgi:hypothetical protein
VLCYLSPTNRARNVTCTEIKTYLFTGLKSYISDTRERTKRHTVSTHLRAVCLRCELSHVPIAAHVRTKTVDVISGPPFGVSFRKYSPLTVGKSIRHCGHAICVFMKSKWNVTHVNAGTIFTGRSSCSLFVFMFMFYSHTPLAVLFGNRACSRNTLRAYTLQ